MTKLEKIKEIIQEKEIWDKPMPKRKKQGPLTARQKSMAKTRARKAGRRYPNMVDNMWASSQ